MASSLAGVVGTATQGAYAAANAFQDAFARFRHAQSLPALSLDLGLILEIGSVSASVGFQKRFQRTTTYGISESEFLQHLDAAFGQASAHLTDEESLEKLDPLSSAQIALGLEPGRFNAYVEEDRMGDITWRTDARFQTVLQAIYHRAQDGTNPATHNEARSSISTQLKQAPSASEKRSIAQTAVAERMGKLLGVPPEQVQMDVPVAHYGIDSLVAAELRNWLHTTFSIDMPLMQLLSKSTRIEDIVYTLVAKSSTDIGPGHSEGNGVVKMIGR
jgi:acyl carrier protein